MLTALNVPRRANTLCARFQLSRKGRSPELLASFVQLNLPAMQWGVQGESTWWGRWLRSPVLRTGDRGERETPCSGRVSSYTNLSADRCKHLDLVFTLSINSINAPSTFKQKYRGTDQVLCCFVGVRRRRTSLVIWAIPPWRVNGNARIERETGLSEDGVIQRMRTGKEGLPRKGKRREEKARETANTGTASEKNVRASVTQTRLYGKSLSKFLGPPSFCSSHAFSAHISNAQVVNDAG